MSGITQGKEGGLDVIIEGYRLYSSDFGQQLTGQAPRTGHGTRSFAYYEGARLQAIQLSDSTMGWFHRIFYGTVRSAGNIMWHSGIEELIEETTTEFKVDAD